MKTKQKDTFAKITEPNSEEHRLEQFLRIIQDAFPGLDKKERDLASYILKLVELETHFKKTENPMFAFFAFFFAWEILHIRPPDWTVSFIAERLRKFTHQEGKISLDDAFGFSRKRGQKKDSGPLWNFLVETRDHDLTKDVLKLTRLGYDVQTACDLVYQAKIQAKRKDKSMLTVPTPATIKKIYHKHQYYKLHRYVSILDEYLRDEQNKNVFLESFQNIPRPKYKSRV